MQNRIYDLAEAKGVAIKAIPAKETSGWVTFFTSIIPFRHYLYFILLLVESSSRRRQSCDELWEK